MRGLCRRLNSLLLASVQRRWDDQELMRPAVVFAPHPDDETLGCGGTILRKRALAAEVHVVFMTDGAQAHARLMPPEEMRALRAKEAVAAAAALGVDRKHVQLLDFPDSQLTAHRAAAAQRVAELLRHIRPEEVFVPYYLDGPPDHLATTDIVRDALRITGLPVTVCEYPIWFWYHWPWSRAQGWGRPMLHDLREGLRRSRRMRRDFRWYVPVGDVLEQKRAVLAEHRSQIQRLVPDPGWVTLGDIAGGDFLACFFRSREVFYRHPPEGTA